MSSLDKQINDLLEKIQRGGVGAPSAASSFDLLAEEKTFLEETLDRLRKRFGEEKLNWHRILDERDATISQLKDQIKRLEEESNKARQDHAALRAEWETQEEMLSLETSSRKVEFSQQMLRYEEEITLYSKQIEDLEQSARTDTQRHESTIRRWEEEEKSWRESLQKREDEILALKTRLNDLDAQRHTERTTLNDERLKIEKTLREEIAKALQQAQDMKSSMETRELEAENFQKLLNLSQEEIAEFTRKLHGQEKELAMSHDHISRLEGELRTLREAWEMERGHWRELWERERSSREKWYDNMREWETHLRQEREQWLNQFHAEAESRQRVNQKVERNVERLKEVVWSFPVFASIGRKAATNLPQFMLGRPSRTAVTAILSIITVVLIIASGASWLWKASRRTAFTSPTPYVAGLATQGRKIWYTDWMSGQILECNTRRPEKIVSFGVQSQDFHPVSLRWAGEHLWSLDPWKRILTEHRPVPPFSAIQSWPLALPSPIDFAWDGQGFWILDQTDTVLRRFRPGEFNVPDKEAVLPTGWRLTALDHRAGEFWAYDESAHRLRRFSAVPHIQITADYRLPIHEGWANPLTGLHVSETHVWTASEKSLKIFRWSRYSMAFRDMWTRSLAQTRRLFRF